MPCYRICKQTKDYNSMRAARKWWEEWDLRILILYILFTQLYLLFFGRSRRKKMSLLLMIVNVWLLYLFADLLATIALGKLSKIKVEDNDGTYARRVLWAPLILFYLGGPDTITTVRLEENKLWVRHLIGLLMQGIRTAYALIVTWSSKHVLSLVAVLMFIPGIINYGERVWIVRSRSKDDRGPVKSRRPIEDQNSASRPNAELVFLAHSWYETLMPHKPGFRCSERTLRTMVTEFCQSVRTRRVDAFQLIEIELGLIYDKLFSKVGTIFTGWGSILRVLSFSFLVSVLVVYLKCEKPPGNSEVVEVDHIITIILLAGAIFLEIGGTVVQLVSDWALVWACRRRSKWASLVLFAHEFLISKRQTWFSPFQQKKSQRWSGIIGQFSFRVFCRKYKRTICNRMWNLLGREKMMKRFSSEASPVPHLKDLIISQLLEKSEKAAVVHTLQTSTKRDADIETTQTSTREIADVDNLQTSSEKIFEGDMVNQTATKKVADVDKLQALVQRRGEWTLVRYNLLQQLKGSIELEFGRSIVIWHVATEVCYEQDHPKILGKDKEKLQAVKILSDYMMYLLVICPPTFPFCDEYDKIMQDYEDMQKLFNGQALGTSSNPTGGNTANIPLANKAQGLVQIMKENPKRWDIMGSMWVEMMCYAAMRCPWNSHIQGIRKGGEFLTHVWLLLMHFGVMRKPAGTDYGLKDENDGLGKKTGEKMEDQLGDDNETNDTGGGVEQGGGDGCFFC